VDHQDQEEADNKKENEVVETLQDLDMENHEVLFFLWVWLLVFASWPLASCSFWLLIVVSCWLDFIYLSFML
jgi:hypothetical protein